MGFALCPTLKIAGFESDVAFQRRDASRRAGSQPAGPQVHPGAPPQLLGVIKPPVGSSGHLTIVRLLRDATVGGTYKFEIAVQPRSSVTVPGSVVLQRFVDL